MERHLHGEKHLRPEPWKTNTTLIDTLMTLMTLTDDTEDDN